MSRISAKLGFAPEEKLSKEDYIEQNGKTTENKAITKHGVLEHLQFSDILLMYDLCRHEQAKEPTVTSVWCAAFGEEDLMV